MDKLVASPPDSVVENANSALTAAGAKRPDSSDDEATPAKKQKTDAGKGTVLKSSGKFILYIAANIWEQLGRKLQKKAI